MNSFLPNNGISDTIIPATIVLGKTKPDLSDPKMCFGEYVLAYTKTKNDMNTIGVTAIALPESNGKGCFYLISLHSVKQIHSFNLK